MQSVFSVEINSWCAFHLKSTYLKESPVTPNCFRICRFVKHKKLLRFTMIKPKSCSFIQPGLPALTQLNKAYFCPLSRFCSSFLTL